MKIEIAGITSGQNCSGGINTQDNFRSELLYLDKIVIAVIG